MTYQSYPRGSLNLKTIKQGIFDWIEAQMSGVIPASQILWRDQSEPLPQRPCITMKIISGPSQIGYSDGQVFTGTLDDMGNPVTTTVNVGGHRSMVVSIQIFGSSRVKNISALQVATDLNSTLRLITVLESLRASGIAVWIHGSPTNITALEETEYEERAQFDVTFGLVQNVTDDPGVITSIGPISKTINQ